MNHSLGRCLAILLALGMGNATAEELMRGQVRVKLADTPGQAEQLLYTKSYALVIGMSRYKQKETGWPPLPGAVDDIQAVAEALTPQFDEVKVRRDLSGKDLRQELDQFLLEHGHEKDNRLLIYFAGHGATRSTSAGVEVGYIVPVDAPTIDRDEKGFLRTALNMEEIIPKVRSLDAKHILFLFDSCFSGTVLNFRSPPKLPPDIKKKSTQPVRQFITAGTAAEQVPDRSLFREYLLRGLKGDADGNKDGYVTASELGGYLSEMIVADSNDTQHPQFGTITDPHLNQGDVVFLVHDGTQAPSVETISLYFDFLTRTASGGEFKKFTKGASLASGDLYKVMVRPESDGYLYLFQVDSTGLIQRLFPMAEFKGRQLNNLNPVKQGQTYLLPSDDKAYRLDRHPGREAFYVFISPTPRPDLEDLAATLAGAQVPLNPQAGREAETRLLALFKSRDLVLEPSPTQAAAPRYVFTQDGRTFESVAGYLRNTCATCVHVLEFNHAE